jgi:hypothetical protein
MRGSGDIIPLWSRTRPPPASALPLPAAVDRESPRARRARRYSLALLGGASIFIAAYAAGTWNQAAGLRDIPASIRTAEYARALADVEATCGTPEAADGLLRRHCLDQAQFLILFPECDARCRGVTNAILPRARR